MVQAIDRESRNNIIKTIGSEMKWEPTVYKTLYQDDYDECGLLFWYNEILRQHQKLDE